MLIMTLKASAVDDRAASYTIRGHPQGYRSNDLEDKRGEYKNVHPYPTENAFDKQHLQIIKIWNSLCEYIMEGNVDVISDKDLMALFYFVNHADGPGFAERLELVLKKAKGLSDDLSLRNPSISYNASVVESLSVDNIIKNSSRIHMKNGSRADEATKMAYLDVVQAIDAMGAEKNMDISLDSAFLRKAINDCTTLGDLNKVKTKLTELSNRVGL